VLRDSGSQYRAQMGSDLKHVPDTEGSGETVLQTYTMNETRESRPRTGTRPGQLLAALKYSAAGEIRKTQFFFINAANITLALKGLTRGRKGKFIAAKEKRTLC
jgi:hypothetical protein